MKTQLKADLMLVLVAMFWGTTYVLTKIGLNDIQEFNLIALRFVIAFILSATVFRKHLIKVDFKTIKYAFILALILFIVLSASTFGVKYTTASNAGFLVSLTVIFVPILDSVFLKQKPEGKVIAAVCSALVGISLLTLDNNLYINIGDLLCIICALLFALHIIVTGVLTKSVNSIALGVFQLGFVGLLSTISSFCIETVKLPDTVKSWFTVLTLSILCTAVAFIIQTTAQRYTSPTRAGLIFSLEPVFSAIFAYFFAGEVLKVRSYVGAVILLASVLIAELNVTVSKSSVT